MQRRFRGGDHPWISLRTKLDGVDVLQNFYLVAGPDGDQVVAAFCEKYAQNYPTAVECLKRDLEACLAFLRNLEEVDCVVAGVTGLAELEELVDASRARVEPAWFARFRCDGPEVIDPRAWPRAGA